ncbi:MAG TPA: Rieske 2Fe-2S domain-containing protein [Chloroflexota bacterium]|nr:Rieske 2Fe-2S domain-containing protein [Chloroflexota bacterium]
MLSTEENQLLTQVGPGTPMGELFRRFWLPAMLSEELPGPDCTPVRLRLLGEDLVAFKDTQGRTAIVDGFCPHRSAPLFFGRNEESGLRCVYHGWKFDVTGACVDMPNCVEGENFRSKVRLTAYPTFDGGGLIWVYMGPPAQRPPHPGYEFLDKPATHRYAFKYLLECNYAQSLENEFDTGHSAFLHSRLEGAQGARLDNRWVAAGMRQNRVVDYSKMQIVDTEFGSALIRRWDQQTENGNEVYSIGTPFWMPCFSAAGALTAPGTFPLNIKVPVDDQHTAFFRYKWSDEPLTEQMLWEMKHGGYEFPAVIPGTFTPKENKSNDYLIDRNRQRFYNYTGISNTPVQDFAVTENQRGPVTDRTRETLVSSDKYLIHVRRRLLAAARLLMQGKEPAEPWHPDAYRQRMRRIQVPPGTAPEEAARRLLDPESSAESGNGMWAGMLAGAPAPLAGSSSQG